MKSRHGKLTFIAIFMLFISSATYAQKEQIYKFKAKVNLVNLQVTVVDKDGNFVEGLKAEDFIILDKGKQQEISHFDYVVHDEFHVDLIKRGSPAYRRHFFLLFDLTFATAKGIVNARKAALNFIENQILSADLIAVGTFSAYQGFKPLVNFTNDKRQLRQVISTLGLIKAGHLISDPNGYNFESLLDTLESATMSDGGKLLSDLQLELNSTLATLFASMKKTDARTYKSHVANFINQLKKLGAALNLIRGKKNIIYFSEGFDGKILTGSTLKELDKDTDAFLRGQFHTIDSDKRFGDAGIRLRMEKMLQEFVASDCIIQTIDIGGLRGEKAAGRFDEAQTGQSTLFLMSHDTGEIGSKICSVDVPDFMSKELAVTSPLFVDNDTDWILSRGYDPNKPEARRQGLPVNYPFTIENQEFIPAVLPELRLNQPAQFCFKVYNLMLHPEAKIPQTTMNFEIIDLQGNSEKLQKISLMSRPTQGQGGCFELYFQCIIEGKPPGEYQFKMTIIDNLAKKQTESSILFILKN